MKVANLFEAKPLNFNSQAILASSVADALKQKFKFKKIGMWLYNSGGDEKNKGSGTIRINLAKSQTDDADFLGKVIVSWLRDNLHSLMQRGISGVEYKGHDADDNTIEFTFNMEP